MLLGAFIFGSNHGYTDFDRNGEIYASVARWPAWANILWFLMGGFLLALGARIAGGCTSGHSNSRARELPFVHLIRNHFPFFFLEQSRFLQSASFSWEVLRVKRIYHFGVWNVVWLCLSRVRASDYNYIYNMFTVYGFDPGLKSLFRRLLLVLLACELLAMTITVVIRVNPLRFNKKETYQIYRFGRNRFLALAGAVRCLPGNPHGANRRG